MSNFKEFDPTPENQRRSIDPHIEVVVHKLTRMATDMDKLANSVEKMSENMGRLVVVEERMVQLSTNIERVNKRLDDGNARFKEVETRVVDLEKKNVTHDNSSEWVEKGLVAMISAVLVFVAHKIGLM